MAGTATRDAEEVRTERGMSLARGPAHVLGTILLAAGLYFLYKQHQFPPFSNLPNAKAPVNGKVLFGIFGANGWTGMLTAVAGGLLLFGAAQHVLAKTLSLIVGAALGAAAVIAFISGDVLGMAAANSWTKLGWAIAAAILLVNAMAPRRERTVVVGAADTDGRTAGRRRRRHTAEAAAAGAAAGAVAEHEHDKHRERRDAEAQDTEATRVQRGDADEARSPHATQIREGDAEERRVQD